MNIFRIKLSVRDDLDNNLTVCLGVCQIKFKPCGSFGSNDGTDSGNSRKLCPIFYINSVFEAGEGNKSVFLSSLIAFICHVCDRVLICPYSHLLVPKPPKSYTAVLFCAPETIILKYFNKTQPG